MMYDQWIQPEQFSLSLPSDWSVREVDGVTEFVPLQGDAAIEVSVLKKSIPSHPTEGEALRLIMNFANKNNLVAIGNYYPRAIGRDWQCTLLHRASDSSSPCFWLVSVNTGYYRATVSSLCSDDTNSLSFKNGEEILRTIKLI